MVPIDLQNLQKSISKMADTLVSQIEEVSKLKNTENIPNEQFISGNVWSAEIFDKYEGAMIVSVIDTPEALKVETFTHFECFSEEGDTNIIQKKRDLGYTYAEFNKTFGVNFEGLEVESKVYFMGIVSEMIKMMISPKMVNDKNKDSSPNAKLVQTLNFFYTRKPTVSKIVIRLYGDDFGKNIITVESVMIDKRLQGLKISLFNPNTIQEFTNFLPCLADEWLHNDSYDRFLLFLK